ncbi:hypothetical protein, partial [Streptomyces sp. NPDC055140]
MKPILAAAREQILRSELGLAPKSLGKGRRVNDDPLRGVTQAEVDRKLHWSPGTCGRIENGNRAQDYQIKALGQLLQLSEPDYIDLCFSTIERRPAQ